MHKLPTRLPNELTKNHDQDQVVKVTSRLGSKQGVLRAGVCDPRALAIVARDLLGGRQLGYSFIQCFLEICPDLGAVSL